MENIYTNCNMVTRNGVIHGSLVVENGFIKELDESISLSPNAIDLESDLLLPGLIEMHTDNLEKNIQPRPGVIWPSILAAALSHDCQIAGAGITTVFDAIAVGGLRESSLRSRIFSESIEAITTGKEKDILKADHFLHLRCEISDEHMAEMLHRHHDNPLIQLISIMDHTPGQRQWSDLSKWRLFHRDKKWTDSEAFSIVSERKEMQEKYGAAHRRLAVSFAHEKKIPIASHDDTTVSDVDTAIEEGIRISEFPTTLPAAARAKEKGMATIMGAPNAIRGKSHSGNISAAALAENSLLDGFSSDYVPSSLLHSAFHLSDALDIPLHETVAMVSCNIADMVGISDRGELLPGKRADMLRVRKVHNHPVLRKVWKKGLQVS